MFGRNKYQGECIGHYTGEGVIDGIRFNKRGGVVNGENGTQVEVYLFSKNTHTGGNMRYPVYEYVVNGVVYRRAKTHVAYTIRTVENMKGKECKVLYDINNPGKSKAK